MKFPQWLAVVTQLAPIVLLSVKGGDKIAPLIPAIVSGITEAEQIAGASGPEKKQHVLNTIEIAVTAVNGTGKTHLNAEEVKRVASHGIDAVIGTVHVIEGAKVQKPVNGTTGE